MEWFFLLSAVILFAVGAAAQIVVVLGLPGAWIILLTAAVIEFLIDPFYLPAGEQQTFSWWVLIACVGIVILGDLFEWIAGALGAKVGGGTKRGMWGALIGGILGAIILTPVFAFLPVIGTLIGALAGTFAGAVVGEVSATNPELAPTVRQSLRPATGATIGRVVGTVSKLGVSIVVWLVLTVAAFVP